MEEHTYHIYPIHKTKTFWHFPNRLHDRNQYFFFKQDLLYICGLQLDYLLKN
jgi:hypothetical protein